MEKLGLRTLKTLAAVLLAGTLHAQNGITWSPTMDVAANSYSNLQPRLAADAAGNPLVIWGRMSDESVFFARWNVNAFSMPVKVNPSGMTIATQSWQGPDIASEGDIVTVVMKQTPEGDTSSHVYSVHSVDGGMNFGAPVRVDAIADSISRFPTVTVDSLGNPIVAFMKFDPGFGNARWVVAKSSDGGISFGPDALASGWSGGTVCDCCPGSIVMLDNKVCMSYRDNLNNVRDMWTGISQDDGLSFTQGMPIDQGNWVLMNCPSSGPDAIMIEDSLFSVFMSQESGSQLVYWSKAAVSSASGAVGTPITGAMSGVSQQNFPRIAQQGTAVAVVWRQTVNMNAQLPILFTNNIAGGFPADYDSVGWGGMSAVVNTDVVIANNQVHVVWQDNASGTVKYRRGSFLPFVGNAESKSMPAFELFPNPAIGTVFITLSPESYSPDARILISDMHGKAVQEMLMQEYQAKMTVDTHAWGTGIYGVKVETSSGAATRKLVVLPK